MSFRHHKWSGWRCLVSGHRSGMCHVIVAGMCHVIVPSVCRDIIPGCGGTSFPIVTTNKNEAIIYAITEAGMSINEAAQRFSLSARWIRVLLGRYHDGGIAALAPRSRRPHTNPTTTSEATRARVIALRHELTSAGLDAGAESIYDRLPGPDKPSVSTIWRILKSQGQVRPQPQKRPRSSWRRFQAEVPNETWQSDFTHWPLADGTVPGRFTPARSSPNTTSTPPRTTRRNSTHHPKHDPTHPTHHRNHDPTHTHPRNNKVSGHRMNDVPTLHSGAGDGNRTRTICLEGRGSTIELHPRGRSYLTGSGRMVITNRWGRGETGQRRDGGHDAMAAARRRRP